MKDEIEITVKRDGKLYRLVPNGSGFCAGCAFIGNSLTQECPRFNNYCLCSDLDGVWKPVKKKKKVYRVVFPYGEERERKFYDEDKLVYWLKNGMYSCEGAERDHYVNMLAEYDAGETVLHY